MAEGVSISLSAGIFPVLLRPVCMPPWMCDANIHPLQGRVTVVALPFSMRFWSSSLNHPDSSPRECTLPSPTPVTLAPLRSGNSPRTTDTIFSETSRAFTTFLRNAIGAFPRSLLPAPSLVGHARLAFGALLKANFATRSSLLSSHRYTHTSTTTCNLQPIETSQSQASSLTPPPPALQAQWPQSSCLCACAHFCSRLPQPRPYLPQTRKHLRMPLRMSLSMLLPISPKS